MINRSDQNWPSKTNHPAVGQLMRNGHIVYYAYIDGRKVTRTTEYGIECVIIRAEYAGQQVGVAPGKSILGRSL